MLKIISGGQAGVDRGALDAALELGIACGGWCPTGRLAEDGKIPERYPVTVLPSAEYSTRTARNIADADGTLIIAKSELSGGTRETLELCLGQAKPCLVIDTAAMAVSAAVESALRFVVDHAITVLNVAGPRASEWPVGRDIAHQIVAAVLRRLSGQAGRHEYSA